MVRHGSRDQDRVSDPSSTFRCFSPDSSVYHDGVRRSASAERHHRRSGEGPPESAQIGQGEILVDEAVTKQEMRIRYESRRGRMVAIRTSTSVRAACACEHTPCWRLIQLRERKEFGGEQRRPEWPGAARRRGLCCEEVDLARVKTPRAAPAPRSPGVSGKRGSSLYSVGLLPHRNGRRTASVGSSSSAPGTRLPGRCRRLHNRGANEVRRQPVAHFLDGVSALAESGREVLSNCCLGCLLVGHRLVDVDCDLNRR